MQKNIYPKLLVPWFKFNNCKRKQIGERTPSTDCHLPLRPLTLVVAYISCKWLHIRFLMNLLFYTCMCFRTSFYYFSCFKITGYYFSGFRIGTPPPPLPPLPPSSRQ